MKLLQKNRVSGGAALITAFLAVGCNAPLTQYGSNSHQPISVPSVVAETGVLGETGVTGGSGSSGSIGISGVTGGTGGTGSASGNASGSESSATGGVLLPVVASVTFNADIRPIFAQNCVSCHKDLTTYSSAFSKRNDIVQAVSIDKSMPQDGTLTDAERSLVAQWVAQGALESAPTAVPTVTPTATPTGVPTSAPTAVPTVVPTAAPTAVPTVLPTATPTAVPTSAPTAVPTATPTVAPSPVPTITPISMAQAAAYFKNTCSGCHAEKVHNFGRPVLLGMGEKYFIKQMKDYKSKARVDHKLQGVMNEYAVSMTDEEVAGVAKLMSSRSLCEVPEWSIVNPRGGNVQAGAAYAEQNDCMNCHGAGKSLPLAGQQTKYLQYQLTAFRAQERTGNKTMVNYAADMTDQEILDVSAYLNSLRDCND